MYFTVLFDQFNASLLNKSIHFLKKKKSYWSQIFEWYWIWHFLIVQLEGLPLFAIALHLVYITMQWNSYICKCATTFWGHCLKKANIFNHSLHTQWLQGQNEYTNINVKSLLMENSERILQYMQVSVKQLVLGNVP